MSQAEELLNSLSEDFPVHVHEVADSGPYFIIDPVTRAITNPTGRPLTLMQRDHNSTVYTFQLPRYIDGHDMLLCNRVKCHFNNIENGEDESLIEHPDVIELTDLRVNPDDKETAICSWVVTRQATWYAGALGFFLQYLCVDNAGNETYEWHTDKFTDILVKKTEHSDEAAVLEYTAVFEQWRERIFGAGDSVKNELKALTEQKIADIESEGSEQVAAIANEGLRVLNTIPEDYSVMSAQVDINKRFSAPVIVQETEGETIVVKDSAKMPVLGLQMFGKSEQKSTKGYQLFDASLLETFTLSGSTVTNNNDGGFAISGSGVITEAFARTIRIPHEELIKYVKAGELYLKCDAVTNPYFYVQIRVNDTYALSISNKVKALESGMVTQEILDDETSVMIFGFYGTPNTDITPGTIKPMVYQDGDGTWEEFTGRQPSPNPEYPQEIKSVENSVTTVCGKNLWDKTLTSNIDLWVYSDRQPGYVEMAYRVGKGSKITVSYEAELAMGLGFYAGIAHSKTESIKEWLYHSTVEKYIANQLTFVAATDYIYLRCSADGVQHGKFLQYVGETLQIEISDIKTDYEPYSGGNINAVCTLPGLPVESGGNYVDSNGQQYIANYRDWERGVDVQRVKTVILDGTCDIHKNSNTWLYYTVTQNKEMDTIIPAVCDRLIKKNISALEGGCEPKHLGFTNSSGNYSVFYINMGYYMSENTVDAMKIALDKYPLTIMYALKEPIETPIPEAELQAYREVHTNYPTTTVLNDSGAHMKLTYGTDTKTYIDKKIEELHAAIAGNS